MAIRRCPYCKAIIDEEDKYCNNCGTQLLFPEDESIEEEIPGDKIIEGEEEEVEKEEFEEGQEEPEYAMGGEEEEGEKKPETEEEDEAAKEEEDEEEGAGEEFGEEEEGEEEKETTEELEAEKESEGEEYKLSEEASEMEETKEETGEWEGEEEELEEEAERGEELLFEPQEKIEEGTEVEDEERPGEKPREDFLRKEDTGEAERKYEVSLEKDELVFKTKDLEGLTRTVDEGKKEVEELLASRQEKRAEPGIEEEEERVPETREELPPWVSGIRDGKTPRVSDQKEERREVQKPVQREWTTDSGVGLPEKLTQTSLPFTDTGVQGVSEVDESREEEEALGQETKGTKIRRQRAVSFPGRLKCKFVDLAFITALWLISLLFAAQVIGVSFFRLMSGSLLPVLGLYFILLFLYFFLFFYFLGETLGDHYFSEED